MISECQDPIPTIFPLFKRDFYMILLLTGIKNLYGSVMFNKYMVIQHNLILIIIILVFL
jgi:hypothetical protein